MQKTEPDRLIRFGVFELDPRTGELSSKGSRVKLQDQPLQILLAVLEKPGEVVTREELRAKLWSVDTFVDFDHGLNAAVKRHHSAYTKGNFQFERTVEGWRERYALLDMRRK